MIPEKSSGSERDSEDSKNLASQSVGSGKGLTGKKDVTDSAREEAMGDIESDADLSVHSPNDDLDEGETARLGEGKNELI
ncbi:MAG TPA: hypothetical protein VM935_07425 [Chitinophagaceae bacterium]|jgi:hypothetical protein|nr:hypothetical protein [Chitinophagaceae bacterium]